ncbi:hypothetical protein MEBOL_002567 [Melittangium boletus DSM 14713]|uniref:Uncharacterized protein n=2 Tax=Melittangium boletus TaxID=83453 RepID=A0A250ID23_9BACT|nr:hypothetical protein MEBOL_002567 [Melittangium boletus DSM 14713]
MGATSLDGPSDRDIVLAQELLEHIEQVLASLARKRDELAADPRSLASRPSYLREFQKVHDLYIEAISVLLEPSTAEMFTRAEHAAEKLPRALLDVDLARLASRPASHTLLEPSRGELTDWVGWLRPKLDTLEQTARRLADARQGGGADVARWEHALRILSEGVQLNVEAMGHWEQALDAYEYLTKGGNVLPAAYASVGRVVTRCREMKTAAMAEKLDVLRERVRRHRDDPDVAKFLRGLPLVVSGSRLLVSLGVTLVASVATAGVGSLVSGALGAARIGTGLSFAGTVVVESLTFTSVSRGAQALIPGEVSPPPFWADLAWNLGLFSTLRGLSVGVRALVRNRGLPSLAEASLQKGGSFGLLQAYGGLHHRVSSGRWPTEDEWRTMTAHNIILMTGLVVGLHVVQGMLPGLGGNSARVRFARAYGARFRALADARAKVEATYRDVQAKGVPTPKEVESLRSRARVLEAEFLQLVEEVEKDPRTNIQALREEWASATGLAEEASAELLARLLDISNAQDALRPLGGERQYSYAWGRTNNLETRFRALGAEVRKTVEPTTRLRSMTVRFGQDAPLTLVERPSPYPALREVKVELNTPEVRELFEEFGISMPKIQRYLVRELATEFSKSSGAGIHGPLRVVRRRLQALRVEKGSVQERLGAERHQGRLRVKADPRLVDVAKRLEKRGIFSSNDWLDGRDENNWRGVVGEWLALESMMASAPAGSLVLSRVHFKGLLFEDRGMTRPVKSGNGEIDVASELDVLVVTEREGVFHYSRVANVKVADSRYAKVFRVEAVKQNRSAVDALRAHHEGVPVLVETQHGRTLYGHIRSITGYDACTGAKVNLSGRLVEAPSGVTESTILPNVPGKAEMTDLSFTYKDIDSITHLLRERQHQLTSEY